MANSLFDLYLKYSNRIARVMENDKYYQYLFTMLESGDTSLQQTNRILHKQLDERWLINVENGIDAIDVIINFPRRFIKSIENVVPIELARKITMDSVRHLSQNTQFIAEADGDNVRPSKILNVSTEESYDLYENRFVNTLIDKLVNFIDKRTDIIFWSTGDERESVLRINSKMFDDYEEINYKVEMNIKNRKSMLETDAQHMETFKRIDRVRRIVMGYKRSEFVSLMKGTAKVRDPIQRTNLLMKEPNYRKCYNLWMFLNSYEDIGYSIEVKDNALDVDQDYVLQMYNTELMTYAIFKSILEDDKRPVDADVKKRKTVRPRFIKQITEEFVNDYDIPDVEIRKVIIEEITKAQYEIEKRQAALEKKRARLEKEKKKKQLARERQKAREKAAKEKEKARKQALREKELAAERLLKEKEAAKEKARLDKEKARLRAEEAAQKAKEKAKAEAQLAKEKEKQRKKEEEAKQKEKARLREQQAKEKAKAAAAEKAKLAKEKEKEKKQAERTRAKEQEKARLAREKAKEKAKEKELKAKAAEAEKARRAKQKDAAAGTAKKTTPAKIAAKPVVPDAAGETAPVAAPAKKEASAKTAAKKNAAGGAAKKAAPAKTAAKKSTAGNAAKKAAPAKTAAKKNAAKGREDKTPSDVK